MTLEEYRKAILAIPAEDFGTEFATCAIGQAAIVVTGRAPNSWDTTGYPADVARAVAVWSDAQPDRTQRREIALSLPLPEALGPLDLDQSLHLAHWLASQARPFYLGPHEETLDACRDAARSAAQREADAAQRAWNVKGAIEDAAWEAERAERAERAALAATCARDADPETIRATAECAARLTASCWTAKCHSAASAVASAVCEAQAQSTAWSASAWSSGAAWAASAAAEASSSAAAWAWLAECVAAGTARLPERGPRSANGDREGEPEAASGGEVGAAWPRWLDAFFAARRAILDGTYAF